MQTEQQAFVSSKSVVIKYIKEQEQLKVIFSVTTKLKTYESGTMGLIGLHPVMRSLVSLHSIHPPYHVNWQIVADTSVVNP